MDAWGVVKVSLGVRWTDGEMRRERELSEMDAWEAGENGRASGRGMRQASHVLIISHLCLAVHGHLTP